MELTPFIALRQTTGIFAFAGAELAKVLGGFGDDVGEEFHLDAAEWFACFKKDMVLGVPSSLSERWRIGWQECIYDNTF